MKIQGIDHISINAKKFSDSVRFYSDILGFEKMETVNFDGYSISYFKLPGNARLELFDYYGNNPETQRDETEVGLRHLAFTVENVAVHEAELRAQGVPIVLPTTEIPALGARVLLFSDPNGVVLEFCEKL